MTVFTVRQESWDYKEGAGNFQSGEDYCHLHQNLNIDIIRWRFFLSRSSRNMTFVKTIHAMTPHQLEERERTILILLLWYKCVILFLHGSFASFNLWSSRNFSILPSLPSHDVGLESGEKEFYEIIFKIPGGRWTGLFIIVHSRSPSGNNIVEDLARLSWEIKQWILQYW